MFSYLDTTTVNITDVDFNASQLNTVVAPATPIGHLAVVAFKAKNSTILLKNVPVDFKAVEYVNESSAFIYSSENTSVTLDNVTITSSITGTMETFASISGVVLTSNFSMTSLTLKSTAIVTVEYKSGMFINVTSSKIDITTSSIEDVDSGNYS